MKRLAIGVLLAAAMAGVFLYTGVTRDTEYRRLVAAGDDALDHDQIFLALEAFSGAIALKSDTMLAYLKRGETYHRRGDLVAALRDLQRATALDPKATRPLEHLGDVYQDLGRYEDAAGHYAAYVALDDQTPHVLYKLALAHHHAERTSRSIPLLQQAIELDGKMPEAHYLLGIGLWDQERLDEATEALRQAVALSPGFLIAREALSGILSATGRLNDHVGELETLAALEPDRPDRDIDLGLGYARVGRTDMAVLALGRAAEEHPEHPQIYTALGRVWLDIAQTTNDRVALSKALGALQSIPVATASSEALTLLARGLLLADERDDAVAALELATERFPLDPSAFVDLAGLAERVGDTARARHLLIDHDALTPNAPTTERVARLTRIADLSLALGDPSDAVVRLGRASALGEPSAGLLIRLANAESRAGDRAAARSVIADGLAMYPTDRTLLALQRRFK
jgi:tetratricopeptide (TPR) repeat protein